MGGGAGNRVRMSNRQEQAHGRDEPAASRERALLPHPPFPVASANGNLHSRVKTLCVTSAGHRIPRGRVA